jgi:hypothetical protein
MVGRVTTAEPLMRAPVIAAAMLFPQGAFLRRSHQERVMSLCHMT